MQHVARDDRPLQGRRVAVTRPVPIHGGRTSCSGVPAEARPASEPDDPLCLLLRQRGAAVTHLPLVRITPPRDETALRRAAARISGYDWIVFTSANAVQALARLRPGTRRAGCRVAVVGSATGGAVERLLGWSVDVVPERYTGQAIADVLTAIEPLTGRHVLWPRAGDAASGLDRILRQAGATVDAPEAYSKRADHAAASELHRLMNAGQVDVVTLTAASAAYVLGAQGRVPAHVQIAAIGPSTAEAARECGMTVHVQPREHTIPGLVEALVLQTQQG